MASPRSVMTELGRLTRLAGEDSAGLGPFLHQHTREIAGELGLSEEVVARAATSSDDQLCPTLALALREWQVRRDGRRQAEVAATAERAAQALGAAAIWEGPRAVLRVEVLFRDVLVDASRKYIRFVSDDVDVAVYRRTLVDTARVMGRFRDVTCFVDGAGLHVRWREGRGQLNYVAQRVVPHENPLVLTVPLARRMELVAVAFAPRPPPRRVSRPTLVGDILANLGFC